MWELVIAFSVLQITTSDYPFVSSTCLLMCIYHATKQTNCGCLVKCPVQNYVIINNLKLKSIEIILSPSEDIYIYIYIRLKKKPTHEPTGCRIGNKC